MFWPTALALVFLAGCSSASKPTTPPTTDVSTELPTPDTTPPPCVGDGCPGGLCAEDSDCQQGACIWHEGGQVCATDCEKDCPAGTVCDDGTGQCVSSAPMLCRPCTEDTECRTDNGHGGTCVSYGDSGSFCGADCEESEDCPAGYFCDAGQCKSGSGVCNCTVASIAAGDTTKCSQTNDSGACLGERTCTSDGLTACDAWTPAEDVCDGLDNNCDGATDTIPCDDNNACTVDSCQGEAGCQFSPDDSLPCDDNDDCTEADACAQGQCGGAPVLCNDDDPCTADTCVTGSGCLFVDNQLCACEQDADCPIPEDRCLGDMKCMVTEAKPFLHCAQDPNTAVLCVVAPGPNAVCLESECEPSTGDCIESAVNDGDPCDADLTCVESSQCTNGTCMATQMKSCDDSNTCTDDLCKEGIGCLFPNNNKPCSDPDICLEDGICEEGACTGESGCDDGNDCTSDACVAGAGCVHLPTAGACTPTDPCFATGTCVDKQCVSSDPIVCDDDEECTIDTCDSASGCMFTPQSDDCCAFGEKPDATCYPPLVADAGPDITVAAGESISIQGTATGGNKEYAFAWTSSEGVSINAQSFSITASTPVTYTLTVTDGVGNTSQDKMTVLVTGVPLSLCNWPVINFDPAGHNQAEALWTFDPACTTATQTINAQPSILLSPLDFEGGVLTGGFHVDTSNDDDLVGFVFGYKSPTDFYVFDWKQKSQTFCGASSFEGVMLKKMTTDGSPLTCKDFYASGGTDNTTIIAAAMPPGWKENQTVPYQWTLTIAGSAVTITIEQGDVLIHEISATLPDFDGGTFGFYNNSQNAVVYELFQFVDPGP